MNRDRTEFTLGELEAMELKEQGLTHSQIGQKLHISKGTVNARICSAKMRMKGKEYQKWMKQ